MKTDCINYNECRLPVTACNKKCKLYHPVIYDKGVAVEKNKPGGGKK